MRYWLNRLWLCAIALSFVFLLPLWFILMSERMGYWFVSITVLVACGDWYRRTRKRVTSPPS